MCYSSNRKPIDCLTILSNFDSFSLTTLPYHCFLFVCFSPKKKNGQLFALYQTIDLVQGHAGQPLASGEWEPIWYHRRGCQCKAMGKKNNLYHSLSQLEEKVKLESSPWKGSSLGLNIHTLQGNL